MRKIWKVFDRDVGLWLFCVSILLIGIFIGCLHIAFLCIENSRIPLEPLDQRAEVVPSEVIEEIITLDGPTVGSKQRSPKWDRLRDNFARAHPRCEICGTTKDINIHHIKPFHLYPELELDETNLITLCRYHHFHVGHLGDWRKENTHLLEDVKRLKRTP